LTTSRFWPSARIIYEPPLEIAMSLSEGETLARVFYNFDDFRVRLDENSPAHYDVEVKRLDPQGVRWTLLFKVYGVDRRGRVIIYEAKWAHSYNQTPRRQKVIDELTEKYATPLNAIPGRIETETGGVRQ